MTAQFNERLRLDGDVVPLCTTPLSDYFALAGEWPKLRMDCTALWRGYLGTWEILGDRLYLVGLEGTLGDGTPLTLEALFPGHGERVFAHWYSGELRIPQGEQLQYVHQGFASRYERDLLIDVERGIVTGRRMRHNGRGSGRGPHGYGVAGGAFFGSRGA